MVGQVIQDVSVNIGATTVDFESAVKKVLVGNEEIQRKLQETATASKRYADEQARSNKRIADGEAGKIKAIQAGEAAVQAAAAKVAAANKAAIQSAQDEAAARVRLQKIIDDNADKESVAAVKRVASAKREMEASRERERVAQNAVAAADRELADTQARQPQIVLEQEQRVNRMRESEANRLAGVLIGIENRMAGLYLKNEATRNAALEKEERARNDAARAAQREADQKERAANQAAAAAEEEARRVAAAKVREIAAAEAAATRQAAAAFRAAEAQEAAAKQAMRGRQAMIQNASFQVADTFTQAQFNGWGRAIATQAPQLLGGMGVQGAVIGAAVAMLAPLALSFFESGEEAEKAAGQFDAFEEQVGSLASSVDDLRAANDAALEPLEEMRKKYGEMTEEVIENRKQMLELKKAQTRDTLRSEVTGFREIFGDPAEYFRAAEAMNEARQKFEDFQSGKTKVDNVGIGLGGVDTIEQALLAAEAAEARFQPFLDALERARDSLSLTDDQAKQLFSQFDNIDLSAAPEVLIGQLREVQATLALSKDETGNMSSEALRLSGVVEGLIGQLIEQTTEIGRSDDAGKNLAGTLASVNVDNGIASVRQLTAELVNAQKALASLRLAQIDERAQLEIEAASAGDPVKRAGMQAGYKHDQEAKVLIDGIDPGFRNDVRARMDEQRAALVAEAEANERLRISIQETAQARQEAEQVAQQTQRESEQIYQQTRTAAENYATELARLKELHASGSIDTDTYNRAVQQLGETKEKAVKKTAEERQAEQEHNALLREAEGVYDSTRTAAEDYGIELERLQQLHAAGYIDAETYSRAVENLGKAYEKASAPPVDKEAQRATREAEREQERLYNEAVREAQGIFDSTRTAAEKYDIELARLNELHAAGHLDADTYARALEKLKEEYSELGDVQATIKDGAKETFRSIITGAGSATEALSRMASRLADMFADRAFEGIWASLGGGFGGIFGGGGGVGGGFFSGLLSTIPGFADGTSNAPGGLAIVGERGRELVNLPRGSQVIPNGQTEQLLRSAGAGRLGIEIVTTPEFEARITRQTEEVAVSTTKRGFDHYDKYVAPATNRRIAANPRRMG